MSRAATTGSKFNPSAQDANDEDAFGQEADLVDQIALLLKDYSGRSDVVAEFVQNTDAPRSRLFCLLSFLGFFKIRPRASSRQWEIVNMFLSFQDISPRRVSEYGLFLSYRRRFISQVVQDISPSRVSEYDYRLQYGCGLTLKS